MSIRISDLIWKVFTTIMNLTNEKNKKLNFFINFILINMNCDLKLPLNKITYFDDIIIKFDCVDFFLRLATVARVMITGQTTLTLSCVISVPTCFYIFS